MLIIVHFLWKWDDYHKKGKEKSYCEPPASYHTPLTKEVIIIIITIISKVDSDKKWGKCLDSDWVSTEIPHS